MFAFDERKNAYPPIALPPSKGADQFKTLAALAGVAVNTVTLSGTVNGVLETTAEFGP
jgi:hypothetical protein